MVGSRPANSSGVEFQQQHTGPRQGNLRRLFHKTSTNCDWLGLHCCVCVCVCVVLLLCGRARLFSISPPRRHLRTCLRGLQDHIPSKGPRGAVLLSLCHLAQCGLLRAAPSPRFSPNLQAQASAKTTKVPLPLPALFAPSPTPPPASSFSQTSLPARLPALPLLDADTASTAGVL